MIKFVNNMMVVLNFLTLSQVIINQVGWIVDTGQVGRQYPHFIYEEIKLLVVQNIFSGDE
jgi:hypothetical protein